MAKIENGWNIAFAKSTKSASTVGAVKEETRVIGVRRAKAWTFGEGAAPGWGHSRRRSPIGLSQSVQYRRDKPKVQAVAAKAVAEQVTDEDLSVGLIYPPQSRILEASLHVAERVAAYIFDQGLARVPRPDDIGSLIRARAYRPVYPE